MINIIYDIETATHFVQALEQFPGQVVQVTRMAINDTLLATRAEMVRMVRADYAVRAGTVRAELGLIRATDSNLSGRIVGEGSPGIPLIEFARTRQVPSTRRLKGGRYTPAKGIPVLIRKDKGKVAAAGIFLARMKSGHIGAFQRVDSMQGDWWRAKKGGRQQIRETYGPSPLKILSSDRYDEQLEDFADDKLIERLAHHAARLLDKQGLR
jgi:hypothetical protein